MNLKFQKIGEKGKEDEYILFYAEDDCFLHNYLIHDDTFDADGDISNKLRHMYRFPYISIKKGQFVALYTQKEGQYNLGSYTHNYIKYDCHIFYWGTNTSVFNQEGDNLYLLLISQTTKVIIK